MAAIAAARTSMPTAVPTVVTLATVMAGLDQGTCSPLSPWRALAWDLTRDSACEHDGSRQGRKVIPAHGRRSASPCRGRFAA